MLKDHLHDKWLWEWGIVAILAELQRLLSEDKWSGEGLEEMPRKELHLQLSSRVSFDCVAVTLHPSLLRLEGYQACDEHRHCFSYHDSDV